ncbi:MAG: MarR family transcriptional regulator [Lachnospiraceae bacterium]|nr:MarR family transcriptional regulator [Lachnospiraceae bacterium]
MSTEQKNASAAQTEYPQLLLENQLCFPFYACARKIVNLYIPYLKPLGITYTQYIVFMVLWEKQEVSVRELCTRLFLDSGTLTPMLKKMEKDGYVTRRRSAEDERVTLIRITDAGMALREQAAEIPFKVGGCLKLPAEEADCLYKIMYQLLEEFQ